MAGMTFQTEPTEILAYGEWDDSDPKFGQFVRVRFDGDQQTRRYTLDKSINGQRPEIGAVVSLYGASVQRSKAYIAKDGEPRVAVREQIRVIGFSEPQELDAAA